ncbi:MAG TPA: pseudouridine synthase, partial [Planctomycetia bacterium]|nr:pseudouridine synthase [Planctomycetia bacterium]
MQGGPRGPRGPSAEAPEESIDAIEELAASDELEGLEELEGLTDLPPAPEGPRLERLAKIMASCGVASRRECEEYIRLGRVTVDGKMVTDVATKLDAQACEIRVDETTLKPEPKVYWLLHKPKGVLSTSKDTHGRRTVLDLLPRTKQRIYAVGRLDEDSTGLLLLTNDGEMALRLTHPRYEVAKTYIALVAGRVEDAVLDQLREGIWLAEGKVRASGVKRLGVQGDSTRLEVLLREGHNREVRRMFAKLGHKVMALHRVAIGPLKLRKLKRGDARPATSEEVYLLRKLCGLVRGTGGEPSQGEERKPRRFPPGRPQRPGRRPGKPDPRTRPQ